MPMTGDGFKFTESTKTKCPCGKAVYFGRGDAADKKDFPMALHELPSCKKYQETELLDYMKYVRLSLSGPEA